MSDPTGQAGVPSGCQSASYVSQGLNGALCEQRALHAGQQRARAAVLAALNPLTPLLNPHASLGDRVFGVLGLVPFVGALGRGIDLIADTARGLGAVRDLEEGPLLLTAGQLQSLAVNALQPHEAAFARDILSLRGGQLVGAPTKSFPGIDAWLDGTPISLKEVSGTSPVSILSQASSAERQARKFGYTGVELFVKAENVSSSTLLDFIPRGLSPRSQARGQSAPLRFARQMIGFASSVGASPRLSVSSGSTADPS